MTLRLAKLHATGNDFLVADAPGFERLRDATADRSTRRAIRLVVALRHPEIGAEQHARQRGVEPQRFGHQLSGPPQRPVTGRRSCA